MEVNNEEITPSAEYLKGYNEGYLISKYMPSFSKSTILEKGTSERSKGFYGGVMEYDLEKKMAKNFPYLSKEQEPSKEDYYKDRGDIDKE